MSDSILKLCDVAAGYDGVAVVRNVNLDIKSDDFIGMIGPNGGGKSTLLKTMLGIIKPISGAIIKHGDIRIGYLPQISSLDKQFPINVMDVVLSGQQGHGRLRPSAEVKQRALWLLDFVGLSDYQRKLLGDLSSGQRQRVLLCRAIMGNPQLLILDEPVTYMDKTAETDLYKLLPELNKSMAILLVSHDIGIISTFVKNIACVNSTLHYHNTGLISEEVLSVYGCPIDVISHGSIPHRVLKSHE